MLQEWKDLPMSQAYREEMAAEIAEWLEAAEGMRVYAECIPGEIVHEHRMTGGYVIYTDRAREFIREYWHEAAETFEYYGHELGMTLNPFEDPELYTVYMLEWGIERILIENEFILEHWGERVTLDAEAIAAIVADL